MDWGVAVMQGVVVIEFEGCGYYFEISTTQFIIFKKMSGGRAVHGGRLAAGGG